MINLDTKKQKLSQIKEELKDLRIKLAFQVAAAAITLATTATSFGFAFKNFVEASDVMPVKLVDVQYELREDPNNYNPSNATIVKVEKELESLSPELDNAKVEASLSYQFAGIGCLTGGLIALVGFAGACVGASNTSERIDRRKRQKEDTESYIEHISKTAPQVS